MSKNSKRQIQESLVLIPNNVCHVFHLCRNWQCLFQKDIWDDKGFDFRLQISKSITLPEISVKFYAVLSLPLCMVLILRPKSKKSWSFFPKPNYADINLTGYHPLPGPLIFFFKISTPGTAFQCKTPAPGSKNETKIPTPRHNLPRLNAKRSMKKEHNSIKAVSFQIFHNLSIWQFSFFVRIKYSQVFIQHLRLTLFEVWRQFENHSQCRKPRYFSVTMLTCAIHIFLGFSAN